jgi:hypothetical protein
MTEPSSGTPSPLPAEPAEPTEPDPAIASDETLDADLELGDGERADEEAADDEEAGADEEDLGEEDEAEEAEDERLETEPSAVEGAFPEAVSRPGGARGVRRRAGAAPVAPRLPTQSELAVRVTDNQSRIFVIATVVVFVAILAFGVFAGRGGVLTPRPTPTPVPSLTAPPSAAPSGSAAPSASAAASESPAASASPSAAASASPS